MILLFMVACGECGTHGECEDDIAAMEERLARIEPRPGISLGAETTSWLVEVGTESLQAAEIGSLLQLHDGEASFEGDPHLGREPRPGQLSESLRLVRRNWQILHPQEPSDPFPFYIAADADTRMSLIQAWLAEVDEVFQPRLLLKLKRPWMPPAIVPPDALELANLVETLRVASQPEELAVLREASDRATGGCKELDRVFEGWPGGGPLQERLEHFRDAAGGVARRCGSGAIDLPLFETVIAYQVAPAGPELVWTPVPRDGEETVADLAASLASRR